ncbi:MAG TPA: hypothetical protein DCO77_08225 [Nitrospiraceae bacterium]|nr:hypothetical protein [Nitrospiraceae bacterium]
MNRVVGILLLIMGLSIIGEPAFSYELHQYERYRRERTDDEALVINRAPTVQGLTGGLMFTNSAYTKRAGHVALGVAVIGENSDIPDYSIVQAIGTFTMGITNSIELGGRAKVITANLGSAATQEQGLGDTEIALKWRIRSQSSGKTIPAIALGIGWMFPTGDGAKGFDEVQKNGLKFMVMASSEARVLDDSFVGVYFEGQAVLIDQITRSNIASQEMYGVVNAGLLFPISEDNEVQFMLEYNQVFSKNFITLGEGNYTAIGPALRYVNRYFNFAFGGQFVNKETAGYDDTMRYFLAMSLNF